MPAISLIDFANSATEQKRKGIVQIITNEPVFTRILRFVVVDGFAYSYSQRATLGGVAFRGVNESYTADTGVVNPKLESLAIFGGQVTTDRLIVEKQGDAARADAIAAKVKKAGLFYDRYVIKGDPANDPKQFYGLNARLTGNQAINMGGALTLAALDQALDSVVGSNEQKKIVCNKTARRKITSLVLAAAGGAAVMDAGKGSGGKQAKQYDGADIEVIDEDGDESPILDFTEAGTSTSLYVIRPGQDVEGEYVQGLISGKMIEHVPVGLQGTYYSDIVEANMGLAVFHPRAACRLYGITNA